ncbi:MAG TPA: TonB-dependent receptor, partial [Candidatus Polarisedimenticolia bacterium]|nr:TonB-dependent receptor [Candidatus Polarisedimenticolia bacterium]
AAEAPKSEAGDQEPAGADLTERIQVTATRIPADTGTLPASLTIVTGEDLRRRGARDLTAALALVAGVSIAPGGDSGPAGSVPEFWGLREFDAFLLTVDGVPWGGAFNPALTTLDLNDVERIEILRGPAPVMYGATSFVGVINVIRRTPGEGNPSARVSGASYGSGSVSWRSSLPPAGGLRSSLDAEAERAGYSDDRTLLDRGIVRWRALHPAGAGLFRFGLGGIWQRQEPASPRPRSGSGLTPLVPTDANDNPEGSHLDEGRYTLDGAYERPLPSGDWSATLSLTRSHQAVLRGFLTDLSAPLDNAHGFRQTLATTDAFFDTHLAITGSPRAQVVAGVDHLHGAGVADGGDFDYTVRPDGNGAPAGASLASQSAVHISDRREFSGLYAQISLNPGDRWHFDIGARLNRTAESRLTRSIEFSTSSLESGKDRRSLWRGGGFCGGTYTAWKRGDDSLRLFTDYRNTYKPAAIDFGLDATPSILAPETGESYEGGLKSRLFGGRLEADLTVFQMDLTNIVVSQSVGGVPSLTNAGAERLRGIELEAAVRVHPGLLWRIGYSLHDARFRDFLTELGGVPTQLAGRRLEMSAPNMASTGLTFGRGEGWQGFAQASWVGSRFLDRQNTAVAPGYLTWDAGLGYRFGEFEVRLDGRNLSDDRPPVAASELGDAQYYLLPARRIELGLRWSPGSQGS